MLSRKDTCVDGWGRQYDCDGVWHGYGRWIFLAIVIIAAIVFFISFSYLSARRRKAHGQRPYVGTAWAAQPPPFMQSSAPPPPYTPNAAPGTQVTPPSGPNAPPQQNGYYSSPHADLEANNGANRGYFGGTGSSGYNMELQQPQNTYQPVRDGAVPVAGSPAYGPPPGAPPGYHPGKGGF